jgi:signal transduction histidine kinase
MIVREVVAMLERVIKAGVRLRCELPEPTIMITADHGQLVQVLFNLAVNADDAMPEGGELIIRSGLRDGWAVLEVEDTGIGVAPEIMDRLFEPLFSTKNAGKGTGLGLAVVHTIVVQHRGRVEVASEVGRGTTFTVFLPRIDVPSPPPPGSAVDDSAAVEDGSRSV